MYGGMDSPLNTSFDAGSDGKRRRFVFVVVLQRYLLDL